ncbi:MAG: hypothetical protein U9Q98_00155 [Bacteroidota bacterium]|nr:hypothetical protein [Bacteroidota bacterium]
MNETSTYFFLYENDSFNVKDVLFPGLDNFEGLETFFPMENPSDKAVDALLKRVESL